MQIVLSGLVTKQPNIQWTEMVIFVLGKTTWTPICSLPNI